MNLRKTLRRLAALSVFLPTASISAQFTNEVAYETGGVRLFLRPSATINTTDQGVVQVRLTQIHARLDQVFGMVVDGQRYTRNSFGGRLAPLFDAIRVTSLSLRLHYDNVTGCTNSSVGLAVWRVGELMTQMCNPGRAARLSNYSINGASVSGLNELRQEVRRLVNEERRVAEQRAQQAREDSLARVRQQAEQQRAREDSIARARQQAQQRAREDSLARVRQQAQQQGQQQAPQTTPPQAPQPGQPQAVPQTQPQAQQTQQQAQEQAAQQQAAARADSARRAREAQQEAARVAEENARRRAQAQEDLARGVVMTGAAAGGAMVALAEMHQPSDLKRPSLGFEFTWTVGAGSLPLYAEEDIGNQTFNTTADAAGLGTGAALTLWPYVTPRAGVALIGSADLFVQPFGDELSSFNQFKYGLHGHAGAPMVAAHFEYAVGRRSGDFSETGVDIADETAGVAKYNLSSLGIGARLGTLNGTNLLGMIRQESYDGTSLTSTTTSLRFRYNAWVFSYEWSDNVPLEAGGGRSGDDVGSYYVFMVGIGGPKFWPW